MKYVKVIANTQYCGTENETCIAVDDNLSKEELDQYCEDFAYNNAESFEYLATGWDGDLESDPSQDALDDYYESIEGSWEYVSFEEFKNFWQEHLTETEFQEFLENHC